MQKFPRLKDLREDHDLTQAQIAEILGTVREQYRKYEAGIQELPMRHFITLAKFYNISLDYLAGITQTPTTPGGGPYNVTKIGTIVNNGNMTNHFN